MSLIEVDSWVTEYEACERLNQTMLTQLAQRGKRQRLSPEYNRLTASVQVGLKQFETELGQLKDKLNSSSQNRVITFEEIERRQRQVDTLQSQLQQLQSRFNNVTRLDRSALLEEYSNTTSRWPSTTAARDEDGASSHTENKHDVETLKKSQIDILEQQNRGLDTLSQTIARQRDLASQLGREVEDQNDILDNLANTMDRVDTGVNIETRNIGQVNRRDSTWGYWLMIVLLFVANIVVLFVL